VQQGSAAYLAWLDRLRESALPDLEQVRILLSGVSEWNAWRRKNRNERLRLQRIELGGADLHAVDLADGNLYGAHLVSAKLQDANLRNAILNTANLNRADLTGADLSHAFLGRADLKESRRPAWNYTIRPRTPDTTSVQLREVVL